MTTDEAEVIHEAKAGLAALTAGIDQTATGVVEALPELRRLHALLSEDSARVGLLTTDDVETLLLPIRLLLYHERRTYFAALLEHLPIHELN